MSRSGRIRRFFGEAEFDFCLLIEQVRDLQEITDAGLMVVFERCSLLYVKEIEAVIRLGLIGGGTGREEAHRLVSRHVRDGYFQECSMVAIDIVEATVKGVEDEPLGEPQGAKVKTTARRPYRAGKSGSPTSTEPELPSDSAPVK